MSAIALHNLYVPPRQGVSRRISFLFGSIVRLNAGSTSFTGGSGGSDTILFEDVSIKMTFKSTRAHNPQAMLEQRLLNLSFVGVVNRKVRFPKIICPNKHKIRQYIIIINQTCTTVLQRRVFTNRMLKIIFNYNG